MGGLRGGSSLEIMVSRLENELDSSMDHWEKREVDKFGNPQEQHIQETLKRIIFCNVIIAPWTHM